MYKCELCKKVIGPNVRCHVLVAESAMYEHPPRYKANRIKVEGKWEFYDDYGGYGPQTLKEVKACPACVEKFVPKEMENPNNWENNKPSQYDEDVERYERYQRY